MLHPSLKKAQIATFSLQQPAIELPFSPPENVARSELILAEWLAEFSKTDQTKAFRTNCPGAYPFAQAGAPSTSPVRSPEKTLLDRSPIRRVIGLPHYR
jgi:hypothetical protein